MTVVETPVELVALSEVRRAVRTGVARRVRELAGVSQAELARALGVTPAAISYFESDDRRPSERVAGPWLGLLIAWAESLRTSDDEAVAEIRRTADLLRAIGGRSRP